MIFLVYWFHACQENLNQLTVLKEALLKIEYAALIRHSLFLVPKSAVQAGFSSLLSGASAAGVGCSLSRSMKA